VQASNVAGIATGEGTGGGVELQAHTRSRQRKLTAKLMRAVISLWSQKSHDVSSAAAAAAAQVELPVDPLTRSHSRRS
jgi:hypothetical protein